MKFIKLIDSDGDVSIIKVKDIRHCEFNREQGKIFFKSGGNLTLLKDEFDKLEQILLGIP